MTTTDPTLHPGIDERRVQRDGQTRLLQIVRCTCDGCSKKLVLPACHSRKPADIVMKIAKSRGWKINERKGTYQCPSH